jgi:hypothetical protein
MMRVTTRSAALALGSLAAMTWGAVSEPVEAGQACNRAGLSSPCVSSSDIKASITLEEAAKNARLRVSNDLGDNAVELNGNHANATNLFSNDAADSNGLVKAWAQINADGTIAACWRCNTDIAETRLSTVGNYEVDFTPLAPDISGRPRSATIDIHDATSAASGMIDLADRAGDPSSVFVSTSDPAGVSANRPFLLIIY